jgi:excisionase family DNA binding protein
LTGRLLTARELADQLGVSAETVLRWARREEIPSIHLPGGAVRFREIDIERWLKERAAPSRGVSSTPASTALRLGYKASSTPEVEED